MPLQQYCCEVTEHHQEAIEIASGKFAKPQRKKRIWPVILVPCVTLVLLIAVLAVGIPAVQQAADPYNGRILDSVSAAGIPLGGMTKSVAAQALTDALGLTQRSLELSLPGKTLQLTPEETGIKLDSKALMDAAYAIGRSEEAAVVNLSLAPYLTVNEAAIRAALESEAQSLSGIPTSFALDGDIPSLREDNPNLTLPNLTVTVGAPSCTLDVEEAYQIIQSSLSAGTMEIDLSSAITAAETEALDVDGIWEAVAVDPVDARMDTDSLQPIPGSYGLTFDREELVRQYETAAAGDIIQVPLETVAPGIMGQEVYFQDVLGFCQTPHSDNEKRTKNLELACLALNGVVLEPGETLSYNATLGQRTEEAGYQKAPAYSGTELVDSLGGGICQVSSTLYLSSLYAELETVERVSHGYPVSYIPIGLDATVNWGEPDLKIKNTSDYPVKIVAEVQEGFVRVWIMGTETRDYYIRMGFSSSTDGYAKSFICKYNRETGEQLSREDHRYSSYLGDSYSAVGEIGCGEIYVYGNVKEQPSCSPTPETLEASRNYQQPNTRQRVAADNA